MLGRSGHRESEMCMIQHETPPTVPGYYWWQPPYSEPRIVELCGFDGKAIYMQTSGQRGSFAIPTSGRWWGPISPPIWIAYKS
jgi:hypothetical protein